MPVGPAPMLAGPSMAALAAQQTDVLGRIFSNLKSR
jgi:hypothetical protein